MYHIPVLLKEAVSGLAIKDGGIYVDVTLGGGGHSAEILKQLQGSGHLYAFDQDEDAIRQAKETLKTPPNLTLIDKNFSYLPNCLALYGVAEINGLLADLGVSSHQFDVAERGFSINKRRRPT